MSSSLVLLSGGLDSTVNAYAEKEKGSLVGALTVNYGQRAMKREFQAAANITKRLGIWHQTLELPWFSSISESALTSTKTEIPQNIDLSSAAATAESAKSVWVPNRNGVLINVAAAVAEAKGIGRVVVGFNAEEASTFPDNSLDYLESLTRSFKFSTSNDVQLVCHTVHMNKKEIVDLGKSLGVVFDDIWSCYQGEETACGVCESCQRFSNAMGER